jgi:two-component system, OmpR family, sensor kinase
VTFPRSIRVRLQLWLAFLLVTILSGFGVTSYQLHRIYRLNEIDEALNRRLAALSSDVRPPMPGGPRGRGPMERKGEPGPDDRFRDGPHPPDHGGPHRRFGPDSAPPLGMKEFPFEPPPITLSPRTVDLFDDSEGHSYYYSVWWRDETQRLASTNAPALKRPPRMGRDSTVHLADRGTFRESYLFSDIGECVLVGCSTLEDMAAIHRFAWWLLGAGGSVLALGLGGGWLLIGRAFRPIQDISIAARQISEGNLSERINVAETDSELGRLASVLNSTFARLEASFAQQKQFTADASHELRTPIAVIISEAQATLAQPRSASDYSESVRVCLEAAQQMRKLTQSLLQLARYDAGQEALERSVFDLAEQTQACVELVQPLARERGVSVKCELAPASVNGDPDRLSQVITNLLTNAIYYNRDHGEIRVTTRAENGLSVLSVQDTGQGIGPEDLQHVLERFYRADKTRTRSSGHYGLGLAICKSIVDAHGGTIEVASELGAGSTFTVRLPG